MESEERSEYLGPDQRAERFNFSLRPEEVAFALGNIIREAEERGYQRGKEELNNTLDLQSEIMRRNHEDANNIIERLRAEVRELKKPPCEWEDLKHLQGRELRERLRSRAHVYREVIKDIENLSEACDYPADVEDLKLLFGSIEAKEVALTNEAERLWSNYLTSFEPLLDEPDGAAKIVEALGPTYLSIVVDRAAARRLRDSAKEEDKDGISN